VTIATALTKKLKIEHPVLLAPMAGVAGGALAAAVSNAGGLGIVGGGYGERDSLERELIAAGNTPVGVGFITWSLQKNPDLLNVALGHAPKVMFLSFGELGDFAPKIKKAGIPLIAQVQTLAQARDAVGEGADVIVAQGAEAGGHGSARSTLPFVPAVVDAVGDIPVVAAGGIADGRGLAAALMLGASGVLCGTAFFAGRESLAHPNLKRGAIEGEGDKTQRSSVIDVARGIAWPSQWTIRTLKNAFTDRWGNDIDGLKRNIAEERPRYMAARDTGDTAVSAVIVGEAVDLVRADEAAADIVARIVSQAEARLRSAQNLLT
jgi:nitronate monooxygenase